MTHATVTRGDVEAFLVEQRLHFESQLLDHEPPGARLTDADFAFVDRCIADMRPRCEANICANAWPVCVARRNSYAAKWNHFLRTKR
jgi:hypothetical protein